MRSLLIILTALVIGSGINTQAFAEEQATMNNTEKAVLAVVENMTSAFVEKDIDGVMASYEKELSVVFERGEATTDYEAAKSEFQQAFAFSPAYEYDGHEVFVAGDLAIHIAPWRMTATAPDGLTVQDSGLSVAVLRRQPSGEWLIVIDNPYSSHLERSE